MKFESRGAVRQGRGYEQTLLGPNVFERRIGSKYLPKRWLKPEIFSILTRIFPVEVSIYPKGDWNLASVRKLWCMSSWSKYLPKGWLKLLYILLGYTNHMLKLASTLRGPPLGVTETLAQWYIRLFQKSQLNWVSTERVTRLRFNFGRQAETEYRN